jgi:hypothetical protein
MHYTGATLGVLEQQTVKEFDFSLGAYAPVKIFQIRATAQRYVLAVVHMLPIRQHVRSCAPAEEGPLLEQTHAPAGFSQRDAR